MILETPFPDARPLDAFKDRIVTDPVEVIEEVKSLTNAVCQQEGLLAPIVAFVHAQVIADDVDSSEIAAATARTDDYVHEHFRAEGYYRPRPYIGVGSICIWLVRHKLYRHDHSRITEILADTWFFPDEPTALDASTRL